MALRLYNTLMRQKEDFVPVKEGEVGIYACGVTVYDTCHVGHARSAINFDVITRYLRYRGYKVTYVKNFTDVDDKIIAKANKEGVGFREISERYIAEHNDDMDRLGIERPTVTPRATEHIGGMIELIDKLLKNDLAYVVGGDVYFAVKKFKGYGKLSGRDIDEMMAGARIAVGEKKKDPLDFALWKASKEGEPWWESPWGKGRPGWHIECSVMSARFLGETFDIHGGGEDLVFPHHENEIAQSEGASGKTLREVLAAQRVHQGGPREDVQVPGKLRYHPGHSQALPSGDPAVLRPAEPLPEPPRLLRRDPSERGPDRHEPPLRNPQEDPGHLCRRPGPDACLGEGRRIAGEGKGRCWSGSGLCRSAFGRAWTTISTRPAPWAISLITVRQVNAYLTDGFKPSPPALFVLNEAERTLREVGGVLGILMEDPDVYFEKDRLREAEKRGIEVGEIEALIEERLKARAEKNWKRADEIRDESCSQGDCFERFEGGNDVDD